MALSDSCRLSDGIHGTLVWFAGESSLSESVCGTARLGEAVELVCFVDVCARHRFCRWWSTVSWRRRRYACELCLGEAIIHMGADSFRGRGRLLIRGASFLTSQNPPAGDSISEGDEVCRGETLFHDTGTLSRLIGTFFLHFAKWSSSSSYFILSIKWAVQYQFCSLLRISIHLHSAASCRFLGLWMTWDTNS